MATVSLKNMKGIPLPPKKRFSSPPAESAELVAPTKPPQLVAPAKPPPVARRPPRPPCLNGSVSSRTSISSSGALGNTTTSSSNTTNSFFGDGLDILGMLKTLPHNKSSKYLEAKEVFTIRKLSQPIGITQLADDNIAIGITGEDKVKIFSSEDGRFIKEIDQNFIRPSDMTALPDGRFVVRDKRGIHLFDHEGVFLRSVGNSRDTGLPFGIATDGTGRLISVNTKHGETAVHLFNIESGKLENRVEMTEVIPDPLKSKCRFLAYRKNKVYVTDLGLDLIYCLDIRTSSVRTFGGSGKDLGLFKEPAGLVLDDFGNMIIADAGNHRLQIFDKHRRLQGYVHTSSPIKRPSGLYLDKKRKTLYLLNLRGESMTKFQLM